MVKMAKIKKNLSSDDEIEKVIFQKFKINNKIIIIIIIEK